VEIFGTTNYERVSTTSENNAKAERGTQLELTFIPLTFFTQAFAHSSMNLLTNRALIKWCVAPFLFLSSSRSVLGQETTWLDHSSVVASDASEGDDGAGDLFGGAVAMSGAQMVVGDPYYDGYQGRVYVYSLNVRAFEEDAVLLPVNTTSYFGSAVDIDGDTIVVGANGAAFVAVKNQGGGWTLQQELNPCLAGGTFGDAVAVSGDRIVVGDPGNGVACVFERSGTTWNETTILTSSDISGGQFGFAVDVEGDGIVVGAVSRNVDRGAVYVFALNDAKTWDQTDIVTASDDAINDQFGYSVALSGSSIVVGARFATSNNGKAYVFTRSFGRDLEENKLLQGDASGKDGFGYSVALLGDTAVVGAWYHDSDNGACYIFKRDPTNDSWSQTTKLTSPENNAELLGAAVAISGDFVVAGAPGSSLAGPTRGAAYVFEEEVLDTQTCLFTFLVPLCK
jgi:hypothetical protein